jgi:hypothetical protein
MKILLEFLLMPSKTNELLGSIRHLLIACVFLLGLGVATLGDIAIAIRGSETAISTTARMIGSAIVFGTFVLVLITVFQTDGDIHLGN